MNSNLEEGSAAATLTDKRTPLRKRVWLVLEHVCPPFESFSHDTLCSIHLCVFHYKNLPASPTCDDRHKRAPCMSLGSLIWDDGQLGAFSLCVVDAWMWTGEPLIPLDKRPLVVPETKSIMDIKVGSQEDFCSTLFFKRLNKTTQVHSSLYPGSSTWVMARVCSGCEFCIGTDLCVE